MASAKKKRKRKPQNNLMVLKLLVLVVFVLVVFEGKLIYTMFSNHDVTAEDTASSSNEEQAAADTTSSDGSDQDTQTADSTGSSATASVSGNSLVGIGSVTASASQTETEDPSTSEELDSFAVVPETSPSVDDSYFSDAVFIGDSRMEGFRNTSGITQGDFLTSVGMSLAAIADQKVSTADGNITVYQGLSGKQYGKIYLMLGANDLGYYPWEDFLPHAEKVFEQFHTLQPDAIIYICSCIYVEEDKITTDYVNNENVMKVNNYLLQACEDLDYCYYLNLNEVFSNGYHALIQDASQDGVHLYPEYTQIMLAYLKSHYIAVAPVSDDNAAEEDTDLEES